MQLSMYFGMGFIQQKLLTRFSQTISCSLASLSSPNDPSLFLLEIIVAFDYGLRFVTSTMCCCFAHFEFQDRIEIYLDSETSRSESFFFFLGSLSGLHFIRQCLKWSMTMRTHRQALTWTYVCSKAHWVGDFLKLATSCVNMWWCLGWPWKTEKIENL